MLGYQDTSRKNIDIHASQEAYNNKTPHLVFAETDKTGLPKMDLTNVKIRLKEHSPDWTDARLEKTEMEYRKFLALCKAHPSEKISPCEEVDEMWHFHILDTMHYASDCQSYFGYFLHHIACIGERDVTSGTRTLALYKKHFGNHPKEWEHITNTCAGVGKGCGSSPHTLVE